MPAVTRRDRRGAWLAKGGVVGVTAASRACLSCHWVRLGGRAVEAGESVRSSQFTGNPRVPYHRMSPGPGSSTYSDESPPLVHSPIGFVLYSAASLTLPPE